MRARTCWMPNVSRATRAAMMLELSPLETAAKASAFSTPARSSTSWSKPMPVTLVPLNDGPRRRNASGLLSMTDTVWLRSSRLRASAEPTRPHPMITTCTGETLLRAAPATAWTSLADRGSWRRLETHPARPQAAQHPAWRDPSSEAGGPPCVRQRRTVVGGLRAGRDLHHAVRRGRHRLRVVLEDRDPGRHRDADRGRLLPAERARLPQR